MTIDVTAPIETDQVHQGTGTTSILSIGASVTGKIDAEPLSADTSIAESDVHGGLIDKDWYRLNLQEGQAYKFEGNASVGTSDTLDSIFIRLRDGNGNLLPVDKATGGAEPTITYTASTTGTYFLAVSADGTGDTWKTKTGDYQLKLTDVGAASVWSFNTSSTSVAENEGSVTFTLTRSNPVGRETVYVSTVQNWDGDKDYNHNDYVGLDGRSLTFEDGVATRTVTITIKDDDTPEDDETFGVIAQADPNEDASTFLKSTSFTITDDDQPSATTLETSDQLFAADGGKFVALADFALAAYPGDDQDDPEPISARELLEAKGWEFATDAIPADDVVPGIPGMYEFGTAAALVAVSPAKAYAFASGEINILYARRCAPRVAPDTISCGPGAKGISLLLLKMRWYCHSGALILTNCVLPKRILAVGSHQNFTLMRDSLTYSHRSKRI